MLPRPDAAPWRASSCCARRRRSLTAAWQQTVVPPRRAAVRAAGTESKKAWWIDVEVDTRRAMSTDEEYVLAIEDWHSSVMSDLCFRQGDVITVTSKAGRWWRGRAHICARTYDTVAIRTAVDLPCYELTL
eukprot:SAG11_NODE_8826_length_972_cov_2.085911_3_plen_131_part_00